MLDLARDGAERHSTLAPLLPWLMPDHVEKRCWQSGKWHGTPPGAHSY